MKTGLSGGSGTGEESLPVGGDQVVNLTRRIDKDSLQQIDHVGLGIDGIALTRGDQAVVDGSAFSSGVTARKEIICQDHCEREEMLCLGNLRIKSAENAVLGIRLISHG
jgi:hypothetical protein